jgi:hypothetical protein
LRVPVFDPMPDGLSTHGCRPVPRSARKAIAGEVQITEGTVKTWQ